VDQAGLIAPLLEDHANAVFLAEGVDRGDELDLQPILLRDPFGVLADLLAQGFGEAGIVEETNPVELQVS